MSGAGGVGTGADKCGMIWTQSGLTKTYEQLTIYNILYTIYTIYNIQLSGLTKTYEQLTTTFLADSGCEARHP